MARTLSLQEACIALSIDQATLYRWLIRARMEAKRDAIDKRKRVLSLGQIQELARMHNRILHDISSDAAVQYAIQNILHIALQSRDERIAELERRLAELEAQIHEKLQPAILRPSEADLYVFADQHGISRNEAISRWRTGMIAGSNRGTSRRPIIVLAGKGRRDFWIQFHDTPGFRSCDQCPHS